MTGFTPEIRDSIRQGAVDSAAVIVPLVLNLLPPIDTVLDVGCGEGWFAAEFKRRGCRVHGLDHPSTDAVALVPIDFIPADLTRPLRAQLTGRFDLVVSLEVAEHLPPERASSFVADLCALAPIVLFSAAIPGQGGVNHVNEQWPDYWWKLFDDHGYTTSGFLRWLIWSDDRVENWYRQNLLLAVNEEMWRGGVPNVSTHDFTVDAPPASVVHPVLWNHYRGL